MSDTGEFSFLGSSVSRFSAAELDGIPDDELHYYIDVGANVEKWGGRLIQVFARVDQVCRLLLALSELIAPSDPIRMRARSMLNDLGSEANKLQTSASVKSRDSYAGYIVTARGMAEDLALYVDVLWPLSDTVDLYFYSQTIGRIEYGMYYNHIDTAVLKIPATFQLECEKLFTRPN